MELPPSEILPFPNFPIPKFSPAKQSPHEIPQAPHPTPCTQCRQARAPPPYESLDRPPNPNPNPKPPPTLPPPPPPFAPPQVHTIVIRILAAVAKDPVSADRMSSYLVDFLRFFCLKNPKNQVALHAPDSLEVFVGQLLENVGAERLLLAVFEGNYELCARNNQQVRVLFGAGALNGG